MKNLKSIYITDNQCQIFYVLKYMVMELKMI